MKILTVANQKGGVGKTSVAVHIAFHAIELGQRVLMVDLDGQANTTHCFVSALECGATGVLRASRLFQTDSIIEAPIAVSDYLGLIPADVGINDVEALPLDAILKPREHLARLAHQYDLVIIDTPPTLGRRLLAGLVASNSVFSPFTLERFALDGVVSLLQTIKTVRSKFNPGLRYLGVLPNKVNNRSKSQQVAYAGLVSLVGERGVIPFRLTERVAVQDALAQGMPVWRNPRGESGRAAAREFKAACASIYAEVML